MPRAPRSAPLATAPTASPTVIFSLPLSSLTAEIMVMDIFVPVSPSGTGNTLSWLTASLFLSNRADPALTISRNKRASIALISDKSAILR